MVNFINIWGCSGSGKTSIAKALERSNPHEFVRLPADRYIKSKQNNTEYFHQPIEYCWQDIENIKDHTIGEVIGAPLFDYGTFNRTSETSDKIFTIKPFVIIDSIQPYNKADYTFFVETPLPICKQRIIDRDLLQGSNIIARWEWFLLSFHRYEELKLHATALLNGTLPVEQNVCTILKYIYPH